MSTANLRLPIAILIVLLAATAPVAQGVKVDCYGDPLPAGAVARLGTVRWRNGDGTTLLAFLPDGKTLLSAGWDATVRHWDVATGKETRRFRLSGQRADEARGPILVSADGKTLAFSDRTATYVWDVATGKELRKISVVGGHPIAIALTGDGKTVAVHDSDGTIRVHEVATGKETGRFANKIDKDNPLVTARLAISQDGKKLAAISWRGDEGAQITLWDTGTGEEWKPFIIPELLQQYTPIHFSPDGQWLAWNGRSGSMLAEVANVKEARHLKFGVGKHARVFDDFLFTPDSKTLITWEQFCRHFHLWDVATGKHLRDFRGPQPESHGLPTENLHLAAMSPDGKLLAVGGHTSVISIFDMAKGAEIAGLSASRHTIVHVSFARDGKELFAMDERPSFRAWDAASGKALRSIATPRDLAPTVLSADGQLLASIGHLGSLRLQESATGQQLPGIATKMRRVAFVAMSPDNRLIAVAGTTGKKGQVAVYEVGGKERHRFTLPVAIRDPEREDPDSLGALQFAPDGRVLAALLNGEKVHLWNLTTHRDLPTIEVPKHHSAPVLAFSSDGKSLAVVGDDNVPRLYETATGRLRRGDGPYKAPPESAMAKLMDRSILGFAIGTVALSPDGRLLAHAQPGWKDGTIGVRDVASWEELGQVMGHQGDITALSFSSDGKTLASGSRDTTVLLWDMTRYPAGAKGQAANVDAPARWGDLLSDDAAKAFDAVCALVAAPDKALPFLKDRVRPAAQSDAAAIQHLIANLDDEQFSVRTKASDELARFGETAVPFLRKALEATPSPEARRRLEALLAQEPGRVPTGETLRSLRAIEVLEMIGTPEAKSLLQTLAQGAAEAPLTTAAQAALERLRR
jgi:WD40 repeat protein